ITVANVGDCRAVLGIRRPDGMWQTVALSEDHQPTREDEVRRIVEEHPGEAPATLIRRYDGEPDGPVRVLGWLMPSRAFGDSRLKWSNSVQQLITSLEQSLTHLKLGRVFRPIPDCLTPPYVSSAPELRSYTLVDPCAPVFLILACDGIWDTLSNEQAVAAVAEYLNTEPSPNNPLLRDANAAVHLARAALADGLGEEEVSRKLTVEDAREYRDDITVAVVMFEGVEGRLQAKGRAPWFLRDIVEV
ncbi:phosphatase 2C-like domain-containing protein, partial [Blyttiomyces helicus]